LNSAILKNKKIFIMGGVLLAFCVVLMLIAIIRDYRNKIYTEEETVFEYKNELANAEVVRFGSGVLIYDRDGARALDSSGKIRWAVSYELTNPKVCVCEDAASIYDQGGKVVYVIDKNFHNYAFLSEFNIDSLKVASQGVVCISSALSGKDAIRVYDKEGKLLVDITTLISEEGFLVDFALSGDGTRVVTNYVDFVGDSYVSKLTFYEFGKIGQNKTNNIVGQEFFENRWIIDADFVGSENFCVLFEDGFELYEMRTTQSLILSKKYDNKYITDKVFDSNGFIVVLDTLQTTKVEVEPETKGDKKQTITEVTGVSERRAVCFSNTGSVLASVALKDDEKPVQMKYGEVLLVGEDHFRLVDFEENERFVRKFSVKPDLVSFGSKDEYILSNGNYCLGVKRK